MVTIQPVRRVRRTHWSHFPILQWHLLHPDTSAPVGTIHDKAFSTAAFRYYNTMQYNIRTYNVHTSQDICRIWGADEEDKKLCYRDDLRQSKSCQL